jgi:outer membrane lipoprotein-sorting protein
MKRIIAVTFAVLALSLNAAAPSAESILNAIDNNMTYQSAKSTTRMVIYAKRSSRTVESVNYSQGSDKFFCEYTAPPRDKGTKMLKTGSNLWIYDPGTDRTIQISGNMLKQSVMGSDLSYEDLMEENKLRDSYTASVDGETTYDSRSCWILTLTGKKEGLAYYKRRMYVDKERNVVLYEQLSTKKGKLLKTISASDVQKTGSRWYPRKIVFKDELKSSKGTEYYIDSIQFDLSLPASTFSKANLKK